MPLRKSLFAHCFQLLSSGLIIATLSVPVLISCRLSVTAFCSFVSIIASNNCIVAYNIICSRHCQSKFSEICIEIYSLLHLSSYIILFMAFIYAFALASITSVLIPLLTNIFPLLLIFAVTSPTASLPLVTAFRK